MLKKVWGRTLSELWSIRSRWSLSLSRGSFTRRTNERLYSRRLADLCSAEVDRLVCSRARYKSPRESACILKSRIWPGNKDKQLLTKMLQQNELNVRFIKIKIFYLALNLSSLHCMKLQATSAFPHVHTSQLCAPCPACHSKEPKLTNGWWEASKIKQVDRQGGWKWFLKLCVGVCVCVLHSTACYKFW